MRNYPKIKFKYSWIYDQNWKKWIKIYNKENKKYPSSKEVLSYIKKVDKIWRKDEENVLRELSKITKLEWKSKSINCYVVGQCIPFSDPLTVCMRKNNNKFIDVLIHELIHQLFIQEGNMEKSSEAWKYIYERYKKQPQRTIIHIPLYAIQSHIYLKFFSKQRMAKDIEEAERFPDYKIAWEIVQKEGYQSIIKEFSKKASSFKNRLKYL